MVSSSNVLKSTTPIFPSTPRHGSQKGEDVSKKPLAPECVPANIMNPDGLSLADAEELHERKFKTSMVNLIPFIALPKMIWDALFFNPSKTATDREDFLHGERSYASAIQQEKRKKNAQLKASLLPVVIGVPLHFAFENKSFLSKVMLASISAILTALGYGLLENPKAKNFNEKL